MVGSWSPGIGDPTILGWVTVVCYVLAAVLCRATTVAASHDPTLRAEKAVWKYVTVIMVLLAINKQLDLQSLLTEIGRIATKKLNIYEDRRVIQLTFIAVMLASSLAVACLIVSRIASMGWFVKLSTLGIVVLMAFIMVRAASFHHIDEFLGSDLRGWKFNWILEIGGIAFIAAGALGRLWSFRVSGTAAKRAASAGS